MLPSYSVQVTPDNLRRTIIRRRAHRSQAGNHHMIDLHVHLLPAVDDGASSSLETQTMLVRAQEFGFHTLVTTPHLHGRLDAQYAEQIQSAYDVTHQLAIAQGITVRQGFEVALTSDLPGRLEAGEPITLGGRNAVLVDLPFGEWPHHVDATLFAIQLAGFRPVLAHPERYATIQRDPDRASHLAERGVILQLTLSSLVGLFGRSAQRTAEKLLKRQTVHVVATDAHSAGHRMAAVPSGLARLQALVGKEGVTCLMASAPQALLDGSALPDPPGVSPHRSERLAVLRGFIRRTR